MTMPLNKARAITQVFPCHCVGAEPVAGPGPRLPHHREALCKHLTSLLSFSGYELCMLQSLHLCLTAQQGAHPPERLPVSLSQSSEWDGGESDVQELISDRACCDTTAVAAPDMQNPVFIHKLTPVPLTPMLMSEVSRRKYAKHPFKSDSAMFLQHLVTSRYLVHSCTVSPEAVLNKAIYDKQAKKQIQTRL